MQQTEINTNTIKKMGNFERGKYRYHNKNTQGGNFAIDFSKGNWGEAEYLSIEISGSYNKTGELYGLRIGKSFSIGRLISPMDLNDLISKFKDIVIDEIQLYASMEKNNKEVLAKLER